MSADGPRAHDILLGYEPLAHYGACWHYVWEAYAAAGATTSSGALPTAYDAWNASYGKHHGDRNPPPGAAIWLGRRYDGNMAGDVFIAGDRDGDHAATDQPGWGQTGLVSIQGRIDLTGREYLGWTDHVLDCPIRLGGQPAPTPPAPIPEEEDDMSKMKGGYYTRAADGVTVYILFNEESGFYMEHSGVAASYNNTIAKNWETGSWAPITESHARNLKSGLAAVQPKELEVAPAAASAEELTAWQHLAGITGER